MRRLDNPPPAPTQAAGGAGAVKFKTTHANLTPAPPKGSAGGTTGSPKAAPQRPPVLGPGPSRKKK